VGCLVYPQLIDVDSHVWEVMKLEAGHDSGSWLGPQYAQRVGDAPVLALVGNGECCIWLGMGLEQELP
jgi:hypothetical protein